MVNKNQVNSVKQEEISKEEKEQNMKKTNAVAGEEDDNILHLRR